MKPGLDGGPVSDKARRVTDDQREPDVPTYLVRARTETLGPGRRARLAEQLTDTHTRLTGGSSSSVQVIIEDLQGRDHFVGGRTAPVGSVFVRGHLPAGGEEATTKALATAVREAVVAATDVSADVVWVYLSELAAEGMVEP